MRGCIYIYIYIHTKVFGETCYPYLQDTMKVEVGGSSEKLVPIHESTQHHIPKYISPSEPKTIAWKKRRDVTLQGKINRAVLQTL
jgi:hypothetical protein